jgi:hypothetical protein
LSPYRYRHQGLTLEVGRPLAGCAPAPESAPEVRIELVPQRAPDEGGWRQALADPPRTIWRRETPEGSRLRLRYAGHGEWVEFVVDEHGSRVWISHEDTVPFGDVVEILLGPVFSCVQAQRGNACLHAAVVALPGRTVALAGPPGAGKSTTALALVGRGGTLICDDVAVLGESEGRVTVLPGAPRMRLRRDSARALVGSYDALTPVWAAEHRRPDKRYLTVDGDPAPEGPCPLDAVYVLEPRDPALSEPSVRALTPARALAALMMHRHMAPALAPGSHAGHFEALARIAESIPVRALRRPDGLDTVERTAAVIAADGGAD